MTAEIKALTPRPDPVTVAHLERALELAREGRLHGIILCGELTGGEIWTACSFSDGFACIGALAHAQHQAHATMTESAREDSP